MTSLLNTRDLKKGLWTRDCKYKIVSLHWIGARRFWALNFDSIFRPKIKRPPSERDIFWSESLKARKLLQFSYPTDFFAKKIHQTARIWIFSSPGKILNRFLLNGRTESLPSARGFWVRVQAKFIVIYFHLILSKQTLNIKASIVVSE